MPRFKLWVEAERFDPKTDNWIDITRVHPLIEPVPLGEVVLHDDDIGTLAELFDGLLYADEWQQKAKQLRQERRESRTRHNRDSDPQAG